MSGIGKRLLLATLFLILSSAVLLALTWNVACCESGDVYIVSISADGVSDTEIYYTVNGNNPTDLSLCYDDEVSTDLATGFTGVRVPKSSTMLKIGYLESGEYYCDYIKSYSMSELRMMALGELTLTDLGTYSSDISKHVVSITNNVSTGITIYYTTNGQDPTTSSTVYSPSTYPEGTGILVPVGSTLKAIASNGESSTDVYTLEVGSSSSADKDLFFFSQFNVQSVDLSDSSNYTGSSFDSGKIASIGYTSPDTDSKTISLTIEPLSHEWVYSVKVGENTYKMPFGLEVVHYDKNGRQQIKDKFGLYSGVSLPVENSFKIQNCKFKKNVGYTCDIYLILNGITTDPETGISTVSIGGETYVLGDSSDYSVSLLLTISVERNGRTKSAEYSMTITGHYGSSPSGDGGYNIYITPLTSQATPLDITQLYGTETKERIATYSLTTPTKTSTTNYSGNNSAGNVYMFLASSNNLSNAGKFKLYNTSQGKNTPIEYIAYLTSESGLAHVNGGNSNSVEFDGQFDGGNATLPSSYLVLDSTKASYKPNNNTTYYTYRWYSDGYIEVKIPANGNKPIGDFASDTYQSNIYIYVVPDINVT